MIRPRLLDLFCGAGGAAMGYHLAGFDVVGCDINPQPNYPFPFHQYDALAAIVEQGHRFDFIHASPPCQSYTPLNAYNHHEYPDLIAVTRELLVASGKPWIIENVPQAPLIDPVTLCGPMFGLKLYRHRLFEASFRSAAPAEPPHLKLCARNGYLPTRR